MDTQTSLKKPLSLKIISLIYLLLVLHAIPFTLFSTNVVSSINHLVTASWTGLEYSFYKIPTILIKVVILAFLNISNCLIVIYGYFKITNGSKIGWKIGLLSLLGSFALEIILFAYLILVITPLYRVILEI